MSIADIKTDNAHLMLGDCRQRLKELPDDVADIVITSPPYNMNLRIRNGQYCSRQIVKELSTKYANYDDNLSLDQYYELNCDVLNECLRVADLVFYNVQFLTGNKPALFKLIGHFADQLKEFIVWDKVNAQPAIGEGILNSRFEAILVFQKSAPESRKFSTAQFDRGTLQNVWQIKRGKKKKSDHGAVFPDELVQTIIRNFTSTGDVILDPFTGTGTTGRVALSNDRRFIGVEMDPDYYSFAAVDIWQHR